jgi:hypothetical protein
MGEADNIEFRPSPALRIGLAFVALTCLIPAAALAFPLLSTWSTSRAVAIGIVLLPALLALAVNLILIRLDDSGITARGLFGKRRVPYPEVRWVDERKASVTIETARGPVTSSWLSPNERSRLLRAVIDRARLIRTIDEPPFRVLARYVPRAEDIAFFPHHARKKPDSGDVVS